jgi:hypothetical protein
MPLPRTALDNVAAILAVALPFLGPDAHGPLAHVATSGDPARIAAALAQLGDAQLAEYLERFAGNQEIAGARARLLAPAPVDEGRYTVFGQPLVNRRAIFPFLEALRCGTKRVLIVQSELPRVGKSFTRWIAQEEAQRSSGHTFAHLDLQGVHRLDFIARQMLSWVPAAPPAPTFEDINSTEEAWARAVADHVCTQATADERRTFWFLFDHFDRSTKPPAAGFFFARLAERVATQPAGSRNAMRLILVDHGLEVPLMARANTCEEKVRQIAPEDVEAFFRAAHRDWDDGRVTTEAGDVLAKVAQVHASERLEKLQRLLAAHVGAP